VVQEVFGKPENIIGYSMVQNKTLKGTRSKDNEVLYMLYRAVDETIFQKIVGASTSKEA